MECACPQGLQMPMRTCPCSEQERDAVDWERMEKAWTVRAKTGRFYRNRDPKI